MFRSRKDNFLSVWTIQSRQVLETVKQDGIYVPKISESSFVQNSPYQKEMSALYAMIARGTYKLNSIAYEYDNGVVFGFVTNRGTDIVGLDTYEDFVAFCRESKEHLRTVFETFPDDACVMKLRVHKSICLNIIDLYNWEYLIPPFFPSPLVERTGGADAIIRNMFEPTGVQLSSLNTFLGRVPNGIVLQAHIPAIFSEMVAEVHPMFSLSDAEAS